MKMNKEIEKRLKALESHNRLLMKWVDDVNHDLEVLDKLSPDTIYNKRKREMNR